MRALTALQVAAALAVGVRLARGRDRLPALTPVTTPDARISVVIPARDEEGRIGPCLEAALADPAVTEVVVVDDDSSDGTARLAGNLGAKVVTGAPLPAGWVGKQWALRQGIEAAGGDIVVTLDADTRRRPACSARSPRPWTATTWSAWGPGSSVTAPRSRRCTPRSWRRWSTGSDPWDRRSRRRRTAW